MDFDVRRQTSPLLDSHRYMLMRFVLGSHMANGLSAYRAKESVSELLAATCTCMLTNPILDIATSTIISVSVVKDFSGKG